MKNAKEYYLNRALDSLDEAWSKIDSAKIDIIDCNDEETFLEHQVRLNEIQKEITEIRYIIGSALIAIEEVKEAH